MLVNYSRLRFSRFGWLVAGLFVAMASAYPAPAAAQPPVGPQLTFAKDVAPILQRSCQKCHRPGQAAPMSLMTYEEVRPWARSIRQKVSSRQMPPWHIDKTIGIQEFKDDPSLSDEEIATIVKWTETGTPLGNPADMPPPRVWEDDDKWHIGKPDLIVSSPPTVVPPAGPDLFPNLVAESGLLEDRYIKAIEVKPSPDAKRVVHHLLVYMLDEVHEADTQAGNTEESDDIFLAEYAQGKNGDIFPEGSGKLLRAGAKIKFSWHNHSVGEEIVDVAQVGFVLYPKGYVPPRVLYAEPMGGANGTRVGVDIDIPAGTIVRHDGYTRLALPAKITAFQPHMHTRGRRQCVELIYPDDTQEVLSCADFNFGWHIVYNYADHVAPLAPAGTIVHVISWHDNSGFAENPDPRNWVGPGARTVDEMAFAWMSWYDLTEEEYREEVKARQARLAEQTDQQ